MAQNYSIIRIKKDKSPEKVAKSDDFNEFRSFYVLRPIAFGRIHKKIPCKSRRMGLPYYTIRFSLQESLQQPDIEQINEDRLSGFFRLVKLELIKNKV